MHKTRFAVVIMILSVLVLSVSVSADSAVLGSWRDITPNAYISPPANPKLNSLFMVSANEGWAVGDSRPTTNTTIGLPAIYHWDGATWNLVPAPKFPDFPSSPSAYNLTSVSFGPPKSPISRNDGWAVGFNGTSPFAQPGSFPTALHWDGITWRVQIAGLTGVNAGPLWSVFMVSPTDVWAVGQNPAGAGTFWHWTGSPGLGGGWNLVQPPVAGIPFYSVFMVSATEGWAVGFGGAIYHYTAGSWSAFSSPITTTLRSVYMLTPTDGWAVGDGGIILHFTTGIWTGPVSPGTTINNLLSVSMASATEGWAVGRSGTILHYAGATWTVLPPNLVPTSPVAAFSFNSVFTTTAADIWSVGTAGVILHWDGFTWGAVTSPTLSAFNSISFGPPLTGPTNPNDGWAVGNVSFSEPTIYHWNGFVWTKGVAIGATNNLNSVFMLSTGDVWAVGGGTNATASCAPPICPIIMHYTGGSWNTITPPPGNYRLKSVFMVSPTEGWAVGQGGGGYMASNTGIILHYTVTGGVGTWAIFPAPATPTPIPSLNSVFMLGPNEGWAVGDNATILHYTVTGGVGTWNLVTVSGTPTLSRDANLTSIFMLSPTIGWAVGGIQLPAPAGPGAFSTGPVIIYWDGTKWEPVATPTIPGGTSPTGITSATLKTVYCSGPNDCWTGGLPGKLVATLFHWDGIAWNHVTTSPALLGQNLPTASGGIVTPPILNSIYMTSPSNGWTVGSARTFETIPTGIPGGELAAILRFSPFGGLLTGTSTTTIVSTVSTSTTLITTSIVATSVTSTAITSVSTSSTTGGGGIPGFPVESILAGIVIGLVTLGIMRRKRANGARG